MEDVLWRMCCGLLCVLTLAIGRNSRRDLLDSSTRRPPCGGLTQFAACLLQPTLIVAGTVRSRASKTLEEDW